MFNAGFSNKRLDFGFQREMVIFEINDRCEEECLPLIMETHISRIAVKAKVAEPYPFNEISIRQIKNRLLYALNGFTNSLQPHFRISVCQ